MSYRQLLANLEALPEGERQLAAYSYYWLEDGKEVCGCVLGKGVPDLRRVLAKIPGLSDFGILAKRWSEEGVDLVGMTFTEAKVVQRLNDGYEGGNNGPPVRLGRYAHMTEWLRERVAEEAAA